MKPIDILYTPLDTVRTPKIDTERLLDWVRINTDIQNKLVHGQKDASKVVDPKNYPWKLMYARQNFAWCSNFDREFPELADFFSSAFGLTADDLSTIILLPVKPEFTGVGFFHADLDEGGLRCYIENPETEDFLLIKPTKEAFDSRPDIRVVTNPFGPWDHIQNKEHSAKLLYPNQTFFLNNIRAIHAAKCNIPNALRIAVVIGFGGKIGQLPEHVQNLIVRSAKKFKDHAILWTPET